MKGRKTARLGFVPTGAGDGVRSVLLAAMGVLVSGCGAAVDGSSAGDGGVPRDGGGDVVTSCVSGAACTSNGNPCQTGTTSCASGVAECLGVTSLPAGTACGTNQVCSAGACVACAQGVTCSPGDNVCQSGVISCTSGSPACVQLSNVTNGTPCGTGDVCFDGACTACVSGSACEPQGNSCQTGTMSCGTGQATCVLIGNVADGTACGANEICSGGLCTSCVPAAQCEPGNPPNACQTGTTSCIDGQAMCTATGDAPDGTACGTNGVCASGACTSCVANAPCLPGGNACETGVTSCGTGQSTCVSTGALADGTSCGASGICCGGACATCSTTTNATEACTSSHICAVSCDSGLFLCGGTCVDTTSDSSACGASCRVCPAGSTCVASRCSTEYGDFRAFSPCNPSALIPAGYLVAELVSLPASTHVVGLGVIGNPGNVLSVMALYTDVNGAPSTLVTQTSPSAIVPGPNVLPVIDLVTSSGGATTSYWIVGEFNANVSVCEDTATDNPIYYGMVTFGTIPANFTSVGALTGVDSFDYNFYVVASD
jgi:hypothetical protein